MDIYDDNTSIAGLLQLSQQGTGDASINFQLKGAQEWTIGVDNSDSDKFKISSTAALGFNDGDAVTITTAGNVSIVKDFDVDGHTELDNVNVVGITTFNNNVQLLDNDKLQFGDSQDLEILHENALNASRVINHTGILRFESNDYEFKDKDNGDMMMKLIHDGSVELYHDNEFKFKTTGS